MTPSELASELQQRGIKVEVKADRLVVSPKSALTPELVAEMVEHKPILMQMFVPRDCLVCGRRIVGEPHYWADGLRRCRACYDRWCEENGVPDT